MTAQQAFDNHFKTATTTTLLPPTLATSERVAIVTAKEVSVQSTYCRTLNLLLAVPISAANSALILAVGQRHPATSFKGLFMSFEIFA